MGEVAGLRGRKEDTVSLPHQAASGTATRCNGTQPTDEAMFQTRLKREPGMQEVSSGIWMIWMMRIEGYFTFFFFPISPRDRSVLCEKLHTGRDTQCPVFGCSTSAKPLPWTILSQSISPSKTLYQTPALVCGEHFILHMPRNHGCIVLPDVSCSLL